MFFVRYPTVNYDLLELGLDVTRAAVNLTLRVQMRETIEQMNIPWIWYQVADHDRPDTVATKYYGTPDYTWLVFVMNNMRDLYDWPMDQRTFDRYITRNYGSIAAAQSQIVAYKNADGYEIDKLTYDALSNDVRSFVTAYDQELTVNEAVRTIRLLPRALLPSVERELKTLLQNTPQ